MTGAIVNKFLADNIKIMCLLQNIPNFINLLFNPIKVYFPVIVIMTAIWANWKVMSIFIPFDNVKTELNSLQFWGVKVNTNAVYIPSIFLIASTVFRAFF